MSAVQQALPILKELADESFSENPSIAYRAAHAAPGPGIFAMPNGDGLIITSWQTLNDLKDHELLGAQNRGQRRAGSGPAGALARMAGNGPFFMDEPVHTPFAVATYRPMSPARNKWLKSALTEIAEAAVDRMLASDGEVDLVADYAYVIARDFWLRFLGLPDNARDFLAGSSAAILPMMKFENTPEELAAANAAAEELSAFCQEHYERIGDPAGETLFHLLAPAINACDVPDAPNDPAKTVAALTFDGIDSVASATGNVLYTCLRHPDQWEIVRQDPDRVHDAWQESVRLEPSFVGLHRSALQDLQYEDVLIPGGTNIVMAWGAANQDPRVFTNPEKFDINRSLGEALGFGGGPRICKGRHLAMLEGEIALRVLLEKTTEIELLPMTPDWGAPGLARGIRYVPALLTAR